MKDFPITIGFDDAKFELKSNLKTTDLIGVVCQGTRIVNVVKKQITIDGDDATDVLIELTKQNKKHVQYILSDTITFGGFNIIDLERIYNELEKPIIAVTEKNVDLQSVKKALIKNFPKNYVEKLNKIIKAGNLYQTKVNTAGGISTIYYHSKGINHEKVKILLKTLCIDSKLPEPIRIAHIIGRAIGEHINAK